MAQTLNPTHSLSRRDLIKIALLIIILPFPINWALVNINPLTFMPGANDIAMWIGFGGNYIGGIMGGIISIIILNRTLGQTATLHHDLKILQLNTILYTQQQEWLKDFKQKLADNLKAVDLYVLNTVVSALSMKDYTYARLLLGGINKEIEYQVVMSTFYFNTKQLSKQEKAYLQIAQEIHFKYSSLVKDILYYIPLAEAINAGKPLDYSTLMDYTFTQYDYLKEQDTSRHDIENNVIDQILQLEPDDNITEKLYSIIEMRLTLRTNLYRLKTKLANATDKVIAYEEKRISKIIE